MQNITKRLGTIIVVVAFILLIPFLLTLINPQSHLNGGAGGGWDWGPGDFVIMGALLFLTGVAIDFAWRKIVKTENKVIAILAILGVLALIWVELAVDAVSRAVRFVF